MEGVPSGDLQAKYQKLASEYSKIRSHVHVLKKGILDEQAKASELKELLKDREKSLRKSDLEIDSLNFRNHQLTKRVTVLQDELDDIQLHKNGKKGKHRADDKNASGHGESSADSNTTLLQEELQKKIIENAQLVSQMADKEFELSQLRLRVEDAERQLSEAESKQRCVALRLRGAEQELAAANSCLRGQTRGNNGDLLSEGGSLIGSEDALSTEESQLNEIVNRKNHLLTQLEQEIQSLKIENDLLKMESKRTNKESIAASISVSSATETDSKQERLVTSDKCSRGDQPTVITTLLGRLDCPFNLDEETLAREEALKVYFRDKISQLVTERQKSESMNRHHIDEGVALQARLEYAQQEKDLVQQALTASQSTITRLEDELHSTSSNYDEQLSLLTEHVANLNDKLTQQFEQIQLLKAQLAAKTK